MTVTWLDIGALADIPPAGARIVKTSAGDLAVFRTARDAVHVLRDRCPHKGGPLSQGIVHGDHVTCPLHSWVIALATGEAQGADRGCVRAFRVAVERGRILLDAAALQSDER
jgi:nitrite reductase (NADH) small subunit